MVRRVEFRGPAVSLSLGFPFGGSGVLWFFACKAGDQGIGPYLGLQGYGWLMLGSCCDARGSLCIRCCRPEETCFCSSRLRCYAVLASECGRPGRVLISLVFQVLWYCRARARSAQRALPFSHTEIPEHLLDTKLPFLMVPVT